MKKSAKISREAKIKSIRDSLFRCACLLDDVTLLQDIINYLQFDINERLCGFSSEGLDLDPSLFQETQTLPIVTALAGVSITGKKGIINELFSKHVNINNPKEGVPFMLLHCENLEIQYDWIREYAHTSKFRNTTLNLSNCRIPELPQHFVEGLRIYNATSDKPIQTLDLQDNLLDTFPQNLAKVPELKEVKVEGNPMALIDFVIKHDWNSIKDYLTNLDTRASRWNSTRIFLLGDSCSGKTTLAECLRKSKNTSQGKLSFLTHGISITDNVRLDKKSKKQSNLIFQIWDFGEQEINYPTHEFFLSERVIYLIVFNFINYYKAWEEGDYLFIKKLSYWLQLIREYSHGINTPTILVGTHLDQLNISIEKQNEFLEYLKQTFPKEIYYFISEIAFIGCKNGLYVGQLKEKIIKLTLTPGYLTMIPKTWIQFHDLLINIRSSSNMQKKRSGTVTALQKTSSSSSIYFERYKENYFLTYDQLKQLGDQCKIEGNFKDIIKFLKYSGTIFNFYDVQRKSLQDFYFLDPNWFVTLMSSFLSFTSNTSLSSSSFGLFLKADLLKILKGFGNDLNQLTPIFQLLEKFQIAYWNHSTSFCFNPPISLQDGVLFYPLLPSDIRYNTIINYWPISHNNSYIELGRIYRFSYFPIHLFQKIMNSILHIPSIRANILWRTGMIFEYIGQFKTKKNSLDETILSQQAFIVFTKSLELCIRVRIPKAQQFSKFLLLVEIIDIIESLIESIHFSIFRFIPCSHCISKKNTEIQHTSKHAFPILSRSSKSSDFLGLNMREGIFEFPIRECIQSILKGDRYMYCNHIKSPSRRVRLFELVPDLTNPNIPCFSSSRLTIKEKLGSGNFGTVYKGNLNTSNSSDDLSSYEVAIKRFNDTESNAIDCFRDFCFEISIMSLITHSNIVNLYGYTLKPHLQIIIEYVSGGDLYELLHPSYKTDPLNELSKIPAHEFPWVERILIALDIAKGMNVLQSCDPPIVHRDLRSANIFIVSRSIKISDIRAKVADFGLSRKVPFEINSPLETWRWLAPEIICSNSNYTTKSDIFSFAIICWEIASRSYPYDEYYQDPKYSYSSADLQTRLLHEEKVKQAIINDNLRPSLDNLIPKDKNHDDYTTDEKEIKIRTDFIELISECWSTDPNERPNFNIIIRRIYSLLGIPLSTYKDVVKTSFDNLIRQYDNNTSRRSQLIKKMSILGIYDSTSHSSEFQHSLQMDRSKNFSDNHGGFSCSCIITKSIHGDSTEFLWVGTNDGYICVNNLTTVCYFSSSFFLSLFYFFLIFLCTSYYLLKNGMLIILQKLFH